MTGLLERIGVDLPIFQAGMGGGTAAHELAAAVSEAGGLADAVIAQGVEAGGHVRGVVPALDLLARVRAALPADYPVLLAVVDAAPLYAGVSVRRIRDMRPAAELTRELAG